jgi:hypothetical protein
VGRRKKKKKKEEEGRRRKKKEKEKIDAWMYNTADQTGGEVEEGRKKRGYTLCICTSRSRPCMLRERERRKINVTIHTTLNKTRHFQQ